MSDGTKAQAMWSGWDEPLLEHLELIEHANEIVADGLIIAVHENNAFRLHYKIVCDPAWRVREANVSLLSGNSEQVELRADGAGEWKSPTGAVIPELAGCIDIDIAATPFTNTLPIRRLAMSEGQSATIQVVYVNVPALRVAAMPQRYTCLNNSLYRYDNLSTDFRADLAVDKRGLVLDYPELRRRVWAK
jgi:hypothetical protein